jgi:type I restriction-modification system DNA methylase subunit
VLANGSMSSSQNNEGQIRAAMVDADVVEVMIALPGQLFFNTQIPACLWFLVKDKPQRQGRGAVHRRAQAGDHDQPRAVRAEGRGDRAHRRHRGRLAR